MQNEGSFWKTIKSIRCGHSQKTVPHNSRTAFFCRVIGSRVNSLLLDRLKYSPALGASRLIPPWIQVAVLPVWAPILPTETLALELIGGTTQGSATTWTNKIQDRRNVILC